MVFGITLRRRKTIDEPEPYKPSPSLPALTPTGLCVSDWPESLIDIKKVKEDVDEYDNSTSLEDDRLTASSQKPRQTSFSSSPGKTTVPSFHRPFRPSNAPDGTVDSGSVDEPHPGRVSIASMYASPTSGRLFPRSTSLPSVSGTANPTRRLVRVPPRFNVMVAGGLGAGKTSFLKLFLSTCDISPTASETEMADVKRFLGAHTKHTRALRTASIEVCEDRHERLQLTLIDTVGFDFERGRELELHSSVSSVMKYLDQQFAESMLEESKVIRKNKGDQHVHLCIYLIHPDTILTPSARREQAALRTPTMKSQATLNRRDSLSSITSEETSDTSSDEEYEDPETPVDGNGEAKPSRSSERSKRFGGMAMCPAELRVMKRLAIRCNILPVISHADTLTDERLALVKEVVREEVMAAGIGFTVFDSLEAANGASKSRHRRKKSSNLDAATPPMPPLPQNVGTPNNANVTSGEDTDEERASRPVIKLRSPRSVGRDRSRSRRRMLVVAEDDGTQTVTVPPASDDTPLSPSAWPSQPKSELARMLPFSVISPEETPRVKTPKRRHAKPTAEKTNGTSHPTEPSDVSTADSIASTTISPDPNQETSSMTPPALHEDLHQGGAAAAEPRTPPRSKATTPTVRRRPSIREYKSRIRSPKELRGKFTRKYRWGTMDALDPAHCDFVALRTAVLGTHMRALRNTTKEVLYENFRTEKLLARRATQNFNEAEREKMLQEL